MDSKQKEIYDSGYNQGVAMMEERVLAVLIEENIPRDIIIKATGLSEREVIKCYIEFFEQILEELTEENRENN